MILILTAAATADLEAIGDWIAKENPARALTFVRELRDACQRLLDSPSGYPLVPRFERFGVRRKVHGDYLIFYRPLPGRVEVIHILHGARDYESLLFPTG
ncbi:MAG: type II toxin-antitoxin system RelE/ParE family toxin [Hyphomicrobiales bacterium]